MDQHEFSLIADRYSTSLHSNALRFTQDDDEAKDLVQETLLKGVRFCHKFDEGTNVKAWLYVIMKNTYINSYRQAKRRQEVIQVDDEISSANLMSSASTNSGESTFVMNDIEKAMQSIPENYRIPFQRYFEGYKYEEIAVQMNIPLGTVKTHIHQARHLLKKYLNKYREGAK
ncbi:sigma-70 family RNA polymerase sigma factor [Pedobacter sp. BMA]|uniref:sigma-70 family RNA polymerase sigma factor n=1 Tax=Pedobacter sp. BMA TaxID=1663685 RepID=UPI00064AB9CC|nr:sigma-70 family RNA polymerase sigma factor [Pedobacter sp. BMA]KLT66714.1 RNA polymerase sigma factor [Pedobacter sp. BMA]